MRYIFASPAGRSSRRGTAALEFALIAPLLLMLTLGVVLYAGWFWTAQSVQVLASEGARAAVAGLDDAERDQLARAVIARQADQAIGVDPARLDVRVSSDAEAVTVRVDYDASAHPLRTIPLVPPPPASIKRSALVRVGGY